MRRYVTVFAGLAFMLFALATFAQTTQGTSPSSNSPSTSSTEPVANPSSAQATNSTPAGSEASIEGCLVKEKSDYFLIPKSGNPIRLEAKAGENLSEHEGHRVRVNGSESPITAASSGSSAESTGGAAGAAAGARGAMKENAPSESSAIGSRAGSSSQSAEGSATGTGMDMHKMATQEMSISSIQHVSSECPVNWNSSVPTPGQTSGSEPSGMHRGY